MGLSSSSSKRSSECRDILSRFYPSHYGNSIFRSDRRISMRTTHNRMLMSLFTHQPWSVAGHISQIHTNGYYRNPIEEWAASIGVLGRTRGVLWAKLTMTQTIYPQGQATEFTDPATRSEQKARFNVYSQPRPRHLRSAAVNYWRQSSDVSTSFWALALDVPKTIPTSAFETAVKTEKISKECMAFKASPYQVWRWDNIFIVRHRAWAFSRRMYQECHKYGY